MPSSTPFILQDMPTDWGIPLRNLTFMVGYFSRPQSDIEARSTVSISLVATFNTFEADVASPVLPAYMPTGWAGLACVVGLDFFDEYALPFSHAFKRMPKEAVWYAVGLPSALPAPFAIMLPEMLEPFDRDVCIELFGKLNHLVGYLPHPRPNVVSLSSAEPIELPLRQVR
jgi:hypothetical protein